MYKKKIGHTHNIERDHIYIYQKKNKCGYTKKREATPTKDKLKAWQETHHM